MLLLLSTGMDNNLSYKMITSIPFNIPYDCTGIYDGIQLFKMCHDLCKLFGQLPAETIYHDKKLNSFLIDKFLYPILKWKVLTKYYIDKFDPLY